MSLSSAAPPCGYLLSSSTNSTMTSLSHQTALPLSRYSTFSPSTLTRSHLANKIVGSSVINGLHLYSTSVVYRPLKVLYNYLIHPFTHTLPCKMLSAHHEQYSPQEYFLGSPICTHTLIPLPLGITGVSVGHTPQV